MILEREERNLTRRILSEVALITHLWPNGENRPKVQVSNIAFIETIKNAAILFAEIRRRARAPGKKKKKNDRVES